MEEIMANKVHEVWCSWMSYVFSRSVEEQGAVIIPKGLVDRWKRQINTPYEDLSEEEKTSDRVIAGEILKLMDGDI